MKRLYLYVVLLTLFLSGVFSCTSENPPAKKATIEWRFQTENLEKLAIPRISWLVDSTVLLLDSRVKRESRTLEILDVKTVKRRQALDREKALGLLEKDLGDKTPLTINWPDAIDSNGRAVLYVYEGDLFLVDLASSNVRRLTETDSAESSPAFSPDGKWVSYVRDNDLYAVDWNSGKELRLTKGATDSLLNGPLSWVYWEEIYDHASVPYQWSPDSSAIAYLQTDESMVSISTFVNFKPETQGFVRQRYPKAGQVNPEVRLGIVELASAETIWVDCGKYEYIGRFNWLIDSQRIAVQTLNRRQSDLKLLFADRSTGKSAEVLSEHQPAWINLHSSLYFLKDGKRFIWLSEKDGYQHLYLYSLDGQLIRQLTKGEFMVQSATGRLVDLNSGLVGVDEEKGIVYFTSNKLSQKERHFYRINLDGTGLQQISREHGVHAPSFSPDFMCYLKSYSNSETPPSLTLHKPDGTLIDTITPPAKELIDRYIKSFPEFYTFKADDGLELPAMITKPVNFDSSKKYPVIIYVYGGPGSQQVIDSWPRFMAWNGLLAQEGFCEVVLEVRAGVGVSKALETSIYKRAYGMQNVKDILAGVRWLKSLKYIDPDNLGIWGWSGGGCTTLYTTTHSDVFKAAIAVAPVSDFRYYDTIYTERYLDTPQNNLDGYDEISSVLSAENLKTRLLIIHGTYDDNVHPQNTYAFIDKLIEHNIPFEMMIYPWRKHGISDDPARIHLYTLMLNFWKRNLKAD